MTLDVQTILVVLLINLVATAFSLPLLMGWRVSLPARQFQVAMLLQTAAWMLFLIAPKVHEGSITTVSLLLFALSFTLIWSSIHGWLGPRPGQRLMWGLVIGVPLVYAVTYPSYALRVGLSNALMALQLVMICQALAWPAPHTSRRWRTLVFICAAVLALVTGWRGVLGAFFTDAYPFFRATHPVNLAAVLLYHVTLTLTALGMIAAWREEAERELRKRAQTDGLTGLNNRQTFMERAHLSLSHATRYDEPLSVMVIDIDHFKRINDRLGHAAGDAALKTFARGLRACLRADDLTCRYGGEEFCVLLSRASVDDARRFDARFRDWLARHPTANAPALNYSAGVTQRLPDDRLVDALITRADAALYSAKAMGRGRLVEAELHRGAADQPEAPQAAARSGPAARGETI